MDVYTLLYLKWTASKDLLYSTWKSAQCYVAAWMGGALGKNGYMCVYVCVCVCVCVFVCVWMSSLAVHLNLSQHY